MKRAEKKRRNLRRRVAWWEASMNGASDIVRKHPKGFKKPGSLSK